MPFDLRKLTLLGVVLGLIGVGPCQIGCVPYYPPDPDNSVEIHRGVLGFSAKVHNKADTDFTSGGLTMAVDADGKLKTIDIRPMSYNSKQSVNQAAQAVKMDAYDRQIGTSWAGLNENARIWAPIVGQAIAQVGPVTSAIAQARVALGGIKAAVSPGAIMRAGLELAQAVVSGQAGPASVQAVQAIAPEIVVEAAKHAPIVAQYAEPIFVVVPASQPAASQPVVP